MEAVAYFISPEYYSISFKFNMFIPLVILFTSLSEQRLMIGIASALVVVGGLAQMYVIIIGGQAFPLEIFPGMEIISSGFMDGVPAAYSASLPEIVLGLGMGFGVALITVVIGISALRFLPQSLADDVVDPHYAPAEASA